MMMKSHSIRIFLKISLSNHAVHGRSCNYKHLLCFSCVLCHVPNTAFVGVTSVIYFDILWIIGKNLLLIVTFTKLINSNLVFLIKSLIRSQRAYCINLHYWLMEWNLYGASIAYLSKQCCIKES